MAESIERDGDNKRHGAASEDALHPDLRRGLSPDDSVEDVQAFKYAESRKIGVTGAAFLILNKMIGTGS